MYWQPSKYFRTFKSSADMDFPKYLDIYEFTVVPISLLAPSGSSLKKYDDTDVAAKLREKESNDQPNEVVDTDTSTNPGKVVIIDGMVFVNVIDI